MAFEMPIDKIESKFKLGQNRSQGDREEQSAVSSPRSHREHFAQPSCVCTQVDGDVWQWRFTPSFVPSIILHWTPQQLKAQD